MAGHNKWSKIKHRKAVVDKRRGKVWTKISKAIIVAAKHGGGDPAYNLTLRYAIDEARYANMPRDLVERAIQKGVGSGDTSNFEPVRYEGYAPGGVAIIIDALTDNRTRTVTDIRTAFSKYDGSLGATGCVAYLFQTRGQIILDAASASEDAVLTAALDAGAADVDSPESPGDPFLIYTEPAQFHTVKDALEAARFKITEAEITMIPETRIAVAGPQAQAVLDLIESLEDLDDVQKVHSNADFPDDQPNA